MADNPSDRKIEKEIFDLRLGDKLTIPYGSSTRRVDIAGSIIYDNLSTENPIIYYSDGDEWRPIAGSLERVADVTVEPVGPEGTVVYNDADDSLYVSDGAVWNSVGGGGGAQDLETTLGNGNTSGANNILMDDTQFIQFANTGVITGNNGADTVTMRNASNTALINITDTFGTINMLAQGAAANAIEINAQFGGLDIIADGELDIISSNGRVDILSNATAADSIILRAPVLGAGIQIAANEEVNLGDKLSTFGSAPTVNNGTINTDSTNIAGRVTGWDTNAAGTTTVTFSNAFTTGVPVVILTAANSDANGAELYVSAQSTTSFTITANVAGNTVDFNYFVIAIRA